MTESQDRQSWLSRPLEIPEEALREMTEAAVKALPSETGGLLYPERLGSSWIHVLDNIADSSSVMVFDNEQLIQAGLRFVRHPKDWERLTLWHSHPGGNIGPSRRDMKARIPQMGNLVIALVDGQGIPSWY
jgi:proteasome lid subunit RPN8/RPN11